MKRLTAIILALALVCALAGCGARGYGVGKMTTEEIDALFEQNDIFEFALEGDSARCRLAKALCDENGVTIMPTLEEAIDGEEFYLPDVAYCGGVTIYNDMAEYRYHSLSSGLYYRIRLDILRSAKDGTANIIYTRYSEAEYLPPEEAAQPPEPAALTGSGLAAFGYMLDIPEDIGIYDPNPERDGQELIHWHYDPPLWYSIEYGLFKSYQYDVSYNAAISGDNGIYLSGVCTSIHPSCENSSMSNETNVTISALLAFRRQDIETPEARISYYKNYVLETVAAGSISHLAVYADDNIIVYDMHDFLGIPTMEEQLAAQVNAKRFAELGLDRSWLLDMRDYFLNKDGGIGRFIKPKSGEAANVELNPYGYDDEIAEMLDNLTFACHDTDKTAIGRGAMEYYLSRFDGRNNPYCFLPRYYQLEAYHIDDVRLDRVGENKFGVAVAYGYTSCGGYHRPSDGEVIPNDPTDDARLLHGVTVPSAGLYMDIQELGSGKYKIINIYTGGYSEGTVPVKEDGTLEGNHYLTLTRGDNQKIMPLDMPIPEYIRLNSYKMSTEAVAASTPEEDIKALPEYISLDGGDCYIYKAADGKYLFQRHDGLVTHILPAEEYAALVKLAEDSGK